MPVILAPSEFGRWLDCRAGSAVPVLDLMMPAPEGLLHIRPVTRRVSSVRNEGPELWADRQEALGTRLI